MVELKDKIQSFLDTNETKLSKTPQFKGLYGRKRTYVGSVVITGIRMGRAGLTCGVVPRTKGRLSVMPSLQ